MEKHITLKNTPLSINDKSTPHGVKKVNETTNQIVIDAKLQKIPETTKRSGEIFI